MCAFLFCSKGYAVPDSTTEPNSIASDVTDSSQRPLTINGHHPANGLAPNSVHATSAPSSSSATINTNHTLSSSRYPPSSSGDLHHKLSVSSNTSASAKNQPSLYAQHHHHAAPSSAYAAQLYDSTHSRRSPDGKDNEAFSHGEGRKLSAGGSGQSSAGVTLNNNHNNNNNNNTHLERSTKLGNDISTEIFSTSNENGKINVQVTVLVGEFILFIYHFVWLERRSVVMELTFARVVDFVN